MLYVSKIVEFREGWKALQRHPSVPLAVGNAMFRKTERGSRCAKSVQILIFAKLSDTDLEASLNLWFVYLETR